MCLQVLLMLPESLKLRKEAYARVEVGMFDGPVDWIGVSGETPPFFSFVLFEEYQDDSTLAQYYIGKDLLEETPNTTLPLGKKAKSTVCHTGKSI